MWVLLLPVLAQCPLHLKMFDFTSVLVVYSSILALIKDKQIGCKQIKFKLKICNVHRISISSRQYPVHGLRVCTREHQLHNDQLPGLIS